MSALFPVKVAFPPSLGQAVSTAVCLLLNLWEQNEQGPGGRGPFVKCFCCSWKAEKCCWKKCICLQIYYIGRTRVNAIPTPISAVNLYVLSFWAKILYKSISLDLPTKKSLSYILPEMYLSPLPWTFKLRWVLCLGLQPGSRWGPRIVLGTVQWVGHLCCSLPVSTHGRHY